MPLGGQINTSTGTLYDPSRPGGRMFQSFGDTSFGGAQIAWVNFNNTSTLIFDELGSPAAATTGDTAGTGGKVRIEGPDESFEVNVEPFTGRVTTRRIQRLDASPIQPGGS